MTGADQTEPNEQQIAYWRGDAGEQWVENQEYLDALLAPMSEVVIEAAAVQPRDRVLDVGCGCGTTSLLLAQKAAFVTGVDISTPMVARAVERARDVANVEFIEADASQWQAAEPVSCVFSRFGVMFFDDPVAAFSNLRTNLAPQGRLCFVCWRAPQDNPWLSIPGAAAAPFLPEAPLTEGPDPFAFADTDFVTGILTAAGFTAPAFTLVEKTLNLGRGIDDAIAFLTRIGPLSRVVSELEGADQQAALAAVREALADTVTASGVELPASAWLVTAEVA